tara:strand:- start:899 stop:2191 length:1293 start_codon:yes stop_codon:yes gene_type:complete
MAKLNIRKSIFIKFLICLTFSILVYLSFRFQLIYENNIKILVSFLLVQLIIWGVLIFSKSKFYSIIFYNLCFIIFLNLLLTPLFHLITFDVPTRQPHYKVTKEYNSEFLKGIFFGKHFISADEKGFRTNKKVNYNIKNNDTLRIITIGASTTEDAALDDSKTWSSLLEKNLNDSTKKKIEVINTGMSGLRTEHHYITLKRITKYKPDIVVFMTGINDWNHHIVNSHKKYLFPNYEIKYSFEKSILFKTFGNINKQIYRKLIKKKETKKNLNLVHAKLDIEAYLLPQIDSLNIRDNVKKFKPKDVSQDYKYWTNLIIDQCKKNDPICIFLDQPTAYKPNISDELKKRLWMTPPNQNYTLSFENLIFTTSFYNNWLKEKIISNKLNFCLLSDKIDPTTDYLYDDCHFSENGSQKVSKILANCIKLDLRSILN